MFQKGTMKLVFIGDIVAKPGRMAVIEVLPQIISEEKPDLILANAENLAHGRGITPDSLREMQDAGINYFTSGDHVFWQRDTDDLLDTLPILRPANYPGDTPGKGYTLIDTGSKGKILLINVMGRTSFGGIYSYLEDPFRTCDTILAETSDENIVLRVIDFHAEATSEKYAFAFYFDGRVDAVVGTHTHVPTCDHRILPRGTAFVADIGMTGNVDSVLGVKTEIIQQLFLTARNQRFEWETTGKKALRSVIIDTQENTIKRFDRYL